MTLFAHIIGWAIKIEIKQYYKNTKKVLYVYMHVYVYVCVYIQNVCVSVCIMYTLFIVN